MRRYYRPLIVISSTLALASLFSYAAIELTATPAKPAAPQPVELTPEAKAKQAFLEAKAAAAGGDPEKLMGLATYHLIGLGTEHDEREAARLHGQGAAKGHAGCQYFYGRDLLGGIGVKKDVTAGLEWIRKAAAQQYNEAEYLLYQAYDEGKGVEKNATVAREWLLKAAQHGQHDARVQLAEEILTNNDADRYKAVVTWVRPGALQGHAKSCHVMSFAYQAGIGVKKNPVEAVAWRLVMLNASTDADADRYRSAYDALSEEDQAAAEKRAKELCGKRDYKSPFARDPAEVAAERLKFDQTKQQAEAGDLDAQFDLSRMLEVGKGVKANAEESVSWLRKAAEKGHANSQYGLGIHLVTGNGVMPDPKEAYLWFNKAALQGHAYGEHAVGVCLRDGQGVKADQAEAKKWILLAAEHGHSTAQVEIGKEYFGPQAGLVNDAIAARWFRKSAEQLDLDGLICLGICHLQGRGVAKDKIEGLAWVALGGDRYDDDQRKLVQSMFEDCTEDELRQVNDRAIILKNECRDKFMASLKKAETK